MGKRNIGQPLASVEKAREYLNGLWATWPAESQRTFHACGEVAVAMLLAIRDHTDYMARLKKVRDLASKMRSIDPELARSFLRVDLPRPSMGAFPQAFWAAELIARDPLSVAYDNLAFMLLNDICDLAAKARQSRKITLGYIAGYTSLVTGLKMPSANQLAALAVIHGIEKPTSTEHSKRFEQWTTARKAAQAEMRRLGIPFPRGRRNAE